MFLDLGLFSISIWTSISYSPPLECPLTSQFFVSTEGPFHSTVLIQSRILIIPASTSLNPKVSNQNLANQLHQVFLERIRQSSPLHGVMPDGKITQAWRSGTASSICRTWWLSASRPAPWRLRSTGSDWLEENWFFTISEGGRRIEYEREPLDKRNVTLWGSWIVRWEKSIL